MTFQELLEKLLPILPECTFDDDNDGQLVVYTGLRHIDDGDLVPFEEF